MDPVISAPVVASVAAPRSAAGGGMREVMRLAYPIVLTQMSQTVMHVVDSIFVGRLGAAELGALGFAGIWLWTIFSVFSGTATGVQTFVSQAWGAARNGAAGASAGRASTQSCRRRSSRDSSSSRSPSLPGAHSARRRKCASTRWPTRASGRSGSPGSRSGSCSPVGSGASATRAPAVATIVANATDVVLAYGLVLGRLGLAAWGVARAAPLPAAEWVGAGMLAAAFLVRARARFGTEPVRPDLGRSGASCARGRRSAASGSSTWPPSRSSRPSSRAWGTPRWWRAKP